MGERHTVESSITRGGQFQSTLPAWGSDKETTRIGGSLVVSIHAPRVGERLFTRLRKATSWQFQSTLPAWGSDLGVYPNSVRHWMFQSTLPAWGSDDDASATDGGHSRFNPRSPRGGAT